ncbi:hypothetical protein RAB80_007812 [Fusarium oxysporum f. sp. vasinfectum]|nr:hypothetical protein RAB80_007812 [Fusarium oxysporum f. sp. vasinfectum]
MPSTHERPKPWDTGDVDKWKIDAFTPKDNVGGTFLEESSFSLLFPKYREVYLKEAWPLVTRALEKHGIACTLDLVEGSMAVKTTRKTYDPAAILNARDLIKLLARSVPAPQAIKILEDGVACDVIKIRGLCGSKESFVKRRQRILGPNGSTLKALELLTETYILVHGNTVSAMGPYKGLKELRRVVEDCMQNPANPFAGNDDKTRACKGSRTCQRELGSLPPQLQKRSLSHRRVPHKVTDKTKKTYTPFPPAPEKSKVDKQIETGEYFLAKGDKKRALHEERKEKQSKRKEEKAKEREAEFVPPEEGRPKKKRKKSEE